MELEALFERGLTVGTISERLRCCNRGDAATEVRAELDRLDFDAAGVLDPGSGQVIGWIARQSLGTGECDQYLVEFKPDQTVPESAPLASLIRMLADVQHLFVTAHGGIAAIVTRADLRKPPVRILLFGLVSVFEMHLRYWVRELHPSDTWQQHLTEARLSKAKELLEARRTRNEDISLVDCLQLSDERDILARSAEAIELLGLGSRNGVLRLLRKIERLRDRVAHSQEDLTGSGGWREVSDVVQRIEVILHRSDAALEKRAATGEAAPPKLAQAG